MDLTYPVHSNKPSLMSEIIIMIIINPTWFLSFPVTLAETFAFKQCELNIYVSNQLNIYVSNYNSCVLVFWELFSGFIQEKTNCIGRVE